MIKTNKITWLTVALSLVAGVLATLNLTVFGLPIVWQTTVTVACSALASLGVAPAVGPKLQNLFHLNHTQALALASIFATASVTASTVITDKTTKGAIVGILALLAGMLAGPGSSVPVVVK